MEGTEEVNHDKEDLKNIKDNCRDIKVKEEDFILVFVFESKDEKTFMFYPRITLMLKVSLKSKCSYLSQ